jgi:hypothetical protein
MDSTKKYGFINNAGVRTYNSDLEQLSWAYAMGYEIFSVEADAPGGSTTLNLDPYISASSKEKVANKIDYTKKSDIVERYKEIDDELEETSKKMDKASKVADTLWGPDRFKKMREGIDLIKEENAELSERIKWSK